MIHYQVIEREDDYYEIASQGQAVVIGDLLDIEGLLVDLCELGCSFEWMYLEDALWLASLEV